MFFVAGYKYHIETKLIQFFDWKKSEMKKVSNTLTESGRVLEYDLSSQ